MTSSALFLLSALAATAASPAYDDDWRYSRDVGSSSGSGEYSSSSSGTAYDGNAGSGNLHAFAGTGSGFAGPTPFPYFGYNFPSYPPYPFHNPNPAFDFSAFLQQYLSTLQAYTAQQAAIAQSAAANGHGFYQSGPGYVVWASSWPSKSQRTFRVLPLLGTTIYNGQDTPIVGTAEANNDVNDGLQSATATAQYSPVGGYGSANVNPSSGIANRFGENEGPGPVSSVSGSLPPPQGGGSYGVFTSSASGSSDINGKKTGYKVATVSVNDNGKVTTHTAHDP